MRFVAAILVLISTVAVAVAGQSSAELIITNANIHTLDKRNPRARAVAIFGGRVVAVGSAGTVAKLAGPNTRVIDAGGRPLIPGFNDAHVHLTGIGNLFSYLDIARLKTSREIVDAIRRYSRMLPRGRWILGRGWQNVAVLPSLAEIDAVSGENPVLVYSQDHAQGLANTAALAVSRVVSTNGLISGDELKRVRERLPADHYNNIAEIVESAGNYAASLGVTSVQDVHTDDLFDVLNELAARQKLKVRVYDCTGLADRRRAAKAEERAASGTPMVRRGCRKGSADGDIGEVDELARDIAEADRAGLQVMVHAIGPRSNANILTAFERAAMNGKRDRRFRVEHAARMSRADIVRFRRSEIIPSMQPYLFYSGASAGDDYRRIFDAGTSVAFGSDASMISLNPLLGIHAAVNSGPRSVSVHEAVTAYTLSSAYAEFQEREKGTVEVGKLADLVILSDDIFTIDRSRIKNARVGMTILDGKVVYDKR